MQRTNIADPAFTYDDTDLDGFRAGMARLGPALGAATTGTSVYELAPSQSVCPYHYEHGEEEWLVVLAGRPTLRHPGGEDELAPWDVVFFPRGPEGAHRIGNESCETVRVLMFSTVVYPTATVYPDSDKVAIWPARGDDGLIVRRSSGVDYWDGETPGPLSPPEP